MVCVPGTSASPRSAPVGENSRALVETKEKRVLYLQERLAEEEGVFVVRGAHR